MKATAGKFLKIIKFSQFIKREKTEYGAEWERGNTKNNNKLNFIQEETLKFTYFVLLQSIDNPERHLFPEYRCEMCRPHCSILKYNLLKDWYAKEPVTITTTLTRTLVPQFCSVLKGVDYRALVEDQSPLIEKLQE